MADPNRFLAVEDIGDVAVIKFSIKKLLDEQTIETIGEHFFRIVDELGKRKVLINFQEVKYVAVPMIGKIISFNKRLSTVGGKLILCNMVPHIYEVFEITRLNKCLNILETQEKALEKF